MNEVDRKADLSQHLIRVMVSLWRSVSQSSVETRDSWGLRFADPLRN
jgi:hypothetical protein